MSVMVAELSESHKTSLREFDAAREVAESGHPELTAEECKGRIIRYMIFIEDMHHQYDLDPDEMYSFDQARGLIFRETD